MIRGLPFAAGALLLAIAAVPSGAARAQSLSVTGYADFRLVAPPDERSWVHGGLSKFRYGGRSGPRFAEAVLQADLALDDDFNAIAVLRAEPDEPGVLDALEVYASWHPARTLDMGEGNTLGLAVKAGAFFPTISLENDDLGWASPYTLTPSAINSWIGEELRTIGAESVLRWRTPSFGTVSLFTALLCCNDPTGIMMADRGWALDDRPTGLLERLRRPDATLRSFRQTPPGRTGMFEEIDGIVGWYAGVNWTLPGIGKLSLLRYNNEGDPALKTARDTAWDTRFYSAGFRTQIESFLFIAQALRGQTIVIPRPGIISDTKFQSMFVLGSYDLDENWRVSLREDFFATRRVTATPPHPMDEDGNAMTMAVSWSGMDWLRITGEAIVMDSRRLQYPMAGFAGTAASQNQFQLSARIFY